METSERDGVGRRETVRGRREELLCDGVSDIRVGRRQTTVRGIDVRNYGGEGVERGT